MPPASKRNACVILYDVGTPAEFAKKAKETLLNICGLKWVSKNKDNCRLVLLNTEETNNSVNQKFPAKCAHITEIEGDVDFDPQLILPNLEGVGTGKGDWLFGLTVALEVMKEFIGAKGVMNRQLLFITDFSTAASIKDNRVQYVINNVQQLDVQLTILGPEVTVPHLMENLDDVHNWMQEFELVDETPDLAAARKIVQGTNGIMCGLDVGVHLFNAFVTKWGLQPWNVPLSIGSQIKFATSTTRFLRSLHLGSFKSDAKKEWSWHLVEDILEQVPYSNVIGGVFMHGQFVPLPDDVVQNFKHEGHRCFKILGFTHIKDIPEYFFQGDGSYVVQGSDRTFRLLVKVLAKQQKCAIAIRVYNANNRPKLMLLLPRAEERDFVMVEIPFADKVKVFDKEQDISEAPAIDKAHPAVQPLYNFLSDLDATKGCLRMPLGAKLMQPLRILSVTSKCVRKLLNNEEETDSAFSMIDKDVVDGTEVLKFFPPKVEPKKGKKEEAAQEEDDDDF